MDADGARLLREPDDGVLDRLGADHHQVGELVDHDQQVGQRVLAARPERAVGLGQVAGADDREALVAALHLGDDVGEDGARLLGARDDRRQQVRDRLVVVELDPLRVDQDHPHLVRRRPEQDRGEDRVDAAGLTRAGGACDQDVRHPREVGPDGVSGDVLPEPDCERARGRRQVVVDVPERDDLRAEVRDLDADRLLAGDRREDADLGRRQRVGEIVLQRGDLRHLRPGRELELVARDAGAGDLAHDRCRDTEVRERLDERVSGALVSAADALRDRRRRVQHGAIGQHVRPFGARCVEERRLLVGLPFRVEQERRRFGEAFGDDVRIVVDDVDRRLVHRREVAMVLLCRELFAQRTLERPARSGMRAPHHVTGATEDGAVRGAREQQPAGQERRHADERRARVAEQCGEPAAELISDKAAVDWSRASSSVRRTRRRDRLGTA